jgi:aspartate carbamoyltransferase catalytic subunit
MHLLSTLQIESPEQLDILFREADILRRDPWSVGVDPVALARGRVLAIVKDEGSTRTRVSFEVAMKRIGGEVIVLELDKNSSVAKGETLEDTIRTISGYVDVIVMRHSQKGAVAKCASFSKVPLINAGDGDGEHPTQALLDMYTIKREVGRSHNLNIMIVGDLKCSRTVHSLLNLVSLHSNNNVYLCSPPEMGLPRDYLNKKIRCVEGDMFKEMLKRFGKDLDILYMTRLQKERYNKEMWSVAAPYCALGEEEASYLGAECKVLHPMPRNGEIPTSFDSDPRAKYFDQARNGMFIRMALLSNLFRSGNFFTPALSKI